MTWLPGQRVEGHGELTFDVRHLSMTSGLQELAFAIPDASVEVYLESLAFDDLEPRRPIVAPAPAR